MKGQFLFQNKLLNMKPCGIYSKNNQDFTNSKIKQFAGAYKLIFANYEDEFGRFSLVNKALKINILILN